MRQDADDHRRHLLSSRKRLCENLGRKNWHQQPAVQKSPLQRKIRDRSELQLPNAWISHQGLQQSEKLFSKQ